MACLCVEFEDTWNEAWGVLDFQVVIAERY